MSHRAPVNSGKMDMSKVAASQPRTPSHAPTTQLVLMYTLIQFSLYVCFQIHYHNPNILRYLQSQTPFILVQILQRNLDIQGETKLQ